MRTFPAPRVLVPLVLLATLAACAPERATDPTTPRLTTVVTSPGVMVSPLPESLIRRQLEQAASGLLYTSESDYPFTWFAAPAPRRPLSVEAMRAITGAPADAPAEAISLDQFFARHIESVDPNDSVSVALVPRYVNLRETIRRTLPGARVYRIGAIQVHCYAVGLDREGHVVGLETVAIET